MPRITPVWVSENKPNVGRQVEAGWGSRGAHRKVASSADVCGASPAAPSLNWRALLRRAATHREGANPAASLPSGAGGVAAGGFSREFWELRSRTASLTPARASKIADPRR